MTEPTAHQWKTFGLASIIEGSALGQEHSAARALSNLTQGLHPDIGLRVEKGCSSYWVPGDRKLARALTAGSATKGGNMVAGVQIAGVVEAARPRSVLLDAGANLVTVPSGYNEYAIPSWTESSGGSWLAEGATPAETVLTVSTASARPRFAASRLGLSRRLMIQSLLPIERVVEQELIRSNAALIETGFFRGNGSLAQPLGLQLLPGRQSQSFGAATPTYAELRGMVDKYLTQEADFSKATWFMNPATFTNLLTTEIVASTGQMVAAAIHGPRQFTVIGLPVFLTTAITAGKVLLLDPTRVTVATWGSPMLLIDRYSGGKSLSGAAEVIVTNALDIIHARPSEVVVGS